MKRFANSQVQNSFRRAKNEPFTQIGVKWQNMKESVHYQKNLLKYGIIAGLVSTVVITIYTSASIRLQFMEMEKAQLDILIKQHKVYSEII